MTSTEIPDTVRQLARHGLDRVPENWPSALDRFTLADVDRELSRPVSPFSLERLMAFLSPVAEARLEAMAQAAARVTRQRFGNAIGLYAPLYLSNVCINRCTYCGFNAAHRGERRRLSRDEALRDAGVIAQEGFADLLLVAGEDPEYVTVEFLADLARELKAGPKPLFASVSVEVEPLKQSGYAALFAAGVDGVTLYQETYDRETYACVHPVGPKSGYDARLARQEAAAAAGMRRLGIGALLGLQDWRYEACALAVHARSLIRRYWRARVSVSFPRLRPAPGRTETIDYPVSDRELVQMMLALRLCFPDIGLVLSTRESAVFRDHAVALGITQMSAGSKTAPGGYAEASDPATEQFAVADTRSPRVVAEVLRARGFDPVWKDWDVGFESHAG